MTTQIQFLDMPTSETMSGFVTDKLITLSQKYEWVISAKVYFENLHDPKGKGKLCKIELSLPGPRIFAQSDEHNYELAVKETIKDLEKQLKKRKEVFKAY